MGNESQSKSLIITLFWLMFVSVFTVLKVAPDGLNADILINSVMSLQNITLYYWGQNRLLNVLPLTVAFVKDPAFNLAAVLFFSSLIFYSMLYLMARAATIIQCGVAPRWLVNCIYILMTVAFLFSFELGAISDMVIGHVEYSLPAALILLACSRILAAQKNPIRWWNYILPAAALCLAIGINPSAAILSLYVVICASFYKKKIERSEVVLGLTSVVSFLIWNAVSKHFGSLPYGDFSVSLLTEGTQKTLVNSVAAFNLPAPFYVFFLLSFLSLILYLIKSKGRLVLPPAVFYVIHAAILFSIGWFLLFSSSRWVEMNQFSWRYFTFPIFSIGFIFSIWLAFLLNSMPVKLTFFLTFFGAFATVPFFASSVPLKKFEDYAVFASARSLVQPGAQLYSGNYWVVWPSVLMDMMIGQEAYGLAYRGAGNLVAAKNFVTNKLKTDGYYEVYCLNDTVKNCVAQIESIVGFVEYYDSTVIKDGVHIVRIYRSRPPM